MNNHRNNYINYLGNIEILNDIINKSAELWGDKVAFTQKDNEITYEQFRNDVIKMETDLILKGFHKADTVALVCENCYEWIVAYFAVIGIGCIIVPIDIELTVEKICELISENKIGRILAADRFIDDFNRCKAECLEINSLYTESVLLVTDKMQVERPMIDPDDVCQISFTSGTTGRMKAVMLSQKNLISDALGASKNINAPLGQRLLVMLPFNHMFTLTASLIIPIMRCANMYISVGRKKFVRELMMFRPQWLVVVPAVVKTLIKVISNDASGPSPSTALVLKELGIIVCGGAILEPGYVSALAGFGIVLVNGYGITECSPVVAVNYPDNNIPGSCGVPIDGCEVSIYEPDENGNGEIYIRGDNVFKGYLNAEDNEGVFDGEWFRSGDIGSFKDGILYVTGRKKNLIILENGKNVAAEWLEELLSNNVPYIEEVVVKAENDMITAEIYASGNEELTRDGIKKVNGKLSGYQQIKKITFRERPFVKTPTMKIVRD